MRCGRSISPLCGDSLTAAFRTGKDCADGQKRTLTDKINRRANEMSGILTQQGAGDRGFDTVLTQQGAKSEFSEFAKSCKCFTINISRAVGV
jgi:hypothetical protein